MPLIYLSTYNCAKLAPQLDFLSNFKTSLPSTHESIPKFFVFAFQEISSLSDGSNHQTIQSILRDVYGKGILEQLNDIYQGESISLVGYESIGATGIVLLTSITGSNGTEDLKELLHYQTSSQACGLYFTELKGGVAIRIKYDDQYYTFIGNHLNANEGYADRRNQDYWLIIKNLSFKDIDDDDEYTGVFRNDGHVFFMGDLNYRVDLQSTTTTIGATQYDDTNPLIKYQFSKDELTQALKTHKAFINLQESPITFPPTYKFHLRLNEYKTNRTPSWCDRILYQHYPKDSLKVVEYNSLPEIKGSDHKPVFLILDVNGLPETSVNETGDLIYYDGGEEGEEGEETGGDETRLLTEKIISLRDPKWNTVYLKSMGKLVNSLVWLGFFSINHKIGTVFITSFLVFVCYYFY